MEMNWIILKKPIQYNRITGVGLNNNPCPVTEKISLRLLRLPLHNSLQPD